MDLQRSPPSRAGRGRAGPDPTGGPLRLVVRGGLGLILLSLAAAAFFSAYRSTVRGHASTSWPVVEGRVERSEIERQPRGGAGGDGSAAAPGEVVHVPRVRYRYAVGGQVLTSDRVAFCLPAGAAVGSAELAEVVVARYPVGAAVRVAHDPHRPERAVLEPGACWSTGAIDAGFGLFLVALWCGGLAWTHRKHAAPRGGGSV